MITPISLSPLSTMSGLDHKKSLKPYKAILQNHEEAYRETSGDGRTALMEEIADEIKHAAEKKNAKIVAGEDLFDVCHSTTSQFYGIYVICFNSKSSGSTPTTELFRKKRRVHLLQLVKHGPLGLLQPTSIRRRSMRPWKKSLVTWLLIRGLPNGPTSSLES